MNVTLSNKPVPAKNRGRPRTKADFGIPRPFPRISGREEVKEATTTRTRRQGINNPVARLFRPESKAEAFLVLDREDFDRPAVPAKPSCYTPTPQAARSAEDVSSASASATMLPRGAHLNRFKPSGSVPNLSGLFNVDKDRKQQPEQARGPLTSARAAPVSLPPQGRAPLSSGSTDRAFTRLPQSVNRGLAAGSVPRRSKILPALPPAEDELASPADSTSPQVTSARIPRRDLFQAHKDKVIRGNGGSPRLEPAALDGGEHARAAGNGTFDRNKVLMWSAQEKLRAAKDDDAIRRARLALWRCEEKEGIAAVRDWSKPTIERGLHMDDPASVLEDDALFAPSRGRRKSRESSRQSRPVAPTMSRRASSASAASVYSIVIQPSGPPSARELSPLSDAPSTSTASSGLHVAQEDMPQRIRHILQTRGDFSFHDSDPDFSTFSPHGGDSYHADLSLTIQALRNISDGDLDDIDFDMEDG